MTQTERALVLISGGLDSTVALAKAMKDFQVVMAVTFSYGQRALKKELGATVAIADHYHLAHRVITLPWMAELLPQAMQSQVDSSVKPVKNLQSPDHPPDPMAVETVWVPNRNGVFLNIAASLAEAHQIKAVIFGANADEAVDFPDNTQTYRDRLNDSLAYSTLNQVRVETPVGHLSKTEIIELGVELGAPMNLIWSCYESGEAHCGQCASCIRLKSSLKKASSNSSSIHLAFSH